MLRLLGLASVFSLLGCVTQPLGGRCENNLDCDRGATPTSACVRIGNPSIQCSGVSGAECICCPLSGTPAELQNLCGLRAMPDAVTTDGANEASTEDVADAADADAAAPDAGPGCATACIEGAQYCSAKGVCRALRPLGQACTAARECRDGYCSSGVCCQTACNASGLSCNVDPARAGLCLPTMTDSGVDAPADTNVVDSATPDASAPTDARMDAAAE